ncbi:putative Scm-like with four mbt domains 2 [Aphelenchoides fujianensis]|nr:putative Scm-like with four mbt domains 2 [Aphelenchoides fujianensis]
MHVLEGRAPPEADGNGEASTAAATRSAEGDEEPPYADMPPLVSGGSSPQSRVADDEEEDERPPAPKFEWPTFMAARGSLPATSDLLAAHQLHLERRLAEVLFKPNTPVLVGGGPEKLAALVQCVVGRVAYVRFVGDKTLENTKLEELILAMAPYPTSIFSKDSLFQLRNLSMDQLLAPVGESIKVGHFFELIDAQNPRVVHTVRIAAYAHGWVHAVDAHDHEHRVFVTSERCRRIGWSILPWNDGNFQLRPFLGCTVSQVVPYFVFERAALREHNLERQQVVEVIDPQCRYRILPGVIAEIYNKYFFRVQLITKLHDPEPRSLVCHRGSPDLLPANFCSRTGLRLSVPKGYDEATFTIYKIRGRLLTESYFELPKNVERFDNPRHVEVYDEERGLMIPATILRTHRHLLVLRLENQRGFSSPHLFAYFDERIFRAGTAERCGIPLCRVPQIIDHSMWTIGSDMALVTRPRQHDPANGRRFMVRAFADESQFLPRLFVNLACYKGPFVNEEVNRMVDVSFPAGPLVPVQHFIVQHMLEYVVKRDAVKHCLTTPNSLAPKYAIKLSNPKNEKRCRVVTVEVCERASEFPGWLRQFLLRLDICPGFISPLQRDEGAACPEGCHLVEQVAPWMDLGVHLYNPAPVNKQEELRARRQNTNGAAAPPAKRTRSDLALLHENAADPNADDLNEPLSTRRARRNIVQTKRHEIVIDNTVLRRRLQDEDEAKRANRSGGTFSLTPPPLHDTHDASENVRPHLLDDPEEARIYAYMRQMNERVNARYRENTAQYWLSRQQSQSQSPHANHADVTRAAVRRGNGPRMLFPLQPSDSSASQSPPQVAGPSTSAHIPLAVPVEEEGEEEDEEMDDQPPPLDSYVDEKMDAEEQPTKEPEVKQEAEVEQKEPAEEKPTCSKAADYLRRLQEAEAFASSSMNPLELSLKQEEPSSSGLPTISPRAVAEPLAQAAAYDEPLPPVVRSLSVADSAASSPTPSTGSGVVDRAALLKKHDLAPETDPAKWSRAELGAFILSKGLPDMATFLEEEEFDGEAFLAVKKEDVERWPFKLGPQTRLLRLVAELKVVSPTWAAE